MGYRKIAKYLNEKGIRTIKGNRWRNTQVFSFLKRHKEREERLSFIDKEYDQYGERWKLGGRRISRTLSVAEKTFDERFCTASIV